MTDEGRPVGEMKAMDEDPKLSREITRAALLVAKVLLAIAIPFILLFFVARTHPLLALGALYGLMLAVLIAVVGYYNYQWKKRDWERERKCGAEYRKWAKTGRQLG